MAIEIPSFQDLNPDLIQQELAAAENYLQEMFPNLDLGRGVYHDLVIQGNAVLAATIRTNLNRYLSARSLQQIEADPSLADPDIVDDVLSNWKLTRKSGGVAQGQITMVFDRDTIVVLSPGMPFSANGLEFRTPRTFTAVPSEDRVRGPDDRVFVQLADGNYGFIITVEASEVGVAGNIPKDTLVLPDVLPTGFVTAYATSDFTGGTDEEDNDELIARLMQGIATPGAQNVLNMAALLRNNDTFSLFRRMAVIGFGDQEMRRDRHSIFPISYGGRVDWYIRTQTRLVRNSFPKEATLIGRTDEGSGIWQFSIARYEAPGFYEVVSVLPMGSNEFMAGTLPVIADIRDMNLTGVSNDIETIEESAYTSYQTTTIRFLDGETDVALEVGDRQVYDVTVAMLPLIGEIQAYMSSNDVRCRPADTLVKAPIPCFVKVSFTINRQPDDADPDLDAIKNAVADVVNETGFTGRLFASQITRTIQELLSGTASAGAIDMFGRIRLPDGNMHYLRDSVVLRVPTLPKLMTTEKTVQFFCSPEDVGISIQAGIPMLN